MRSAGLPLTIGYTGHPWDRALGQYAAPFRYYNPATARWNMRAPLGFVDGPNVYAYVVGNPVMRTDDMGLSWLDFMYCMISEENLNDMGPRKIPMGSGSVGKYFYPSLMVGLPWLRTRAMRLSGKAAQRRLARRAADMALKNLGKRLVVGIPIVGWAIAGAFVVSDVIHCKSSINR